MNKTDQLYRDISIETFSRINQIDQVDAFDLAQIGRGILSIHAHWSGYSVMYGKAILGLMDQPESMNFEISIIDVDTISPEKQVELIGMQCHGYFESVWIENGQIEFKYQDNNRATELAKFKDFLNQKCN